TINQRIAILTVSVAGLSPVPVTVTQSGAAPFLNVTPSNRKVDFLAGSTTFQVSSNTNWSAVSNQTWCLVTPNGLGSGDITANYSENTNVSPRVATITVSASGLSPVDVTVSQDGFVGVPELTNEEISVVPNPTEGVFNINTKHLNGEILVVNIYDNAGRFIQSSSCRGKKSYEFDLSTKPKGEYYVRISADGRTVTKKLILK
ncbi:MAG: T9SS type A sorting domain-containing protein, partial [Bacteroidota bacterium]